MEERSEWAQFRFMVIAPLVCRKLTKEARARLKKEILEQTYEAPGGKLVRVAGRTLSHWLKKYRKEGLNGLMAASRSTLGESKAIPKETLAKAVELRQEEPGRSVKQVIKLLAALGFEVARVNRSTLNVQLNRLGATKELLSGDRGNFQRWEQKAANVLWQADTSHGLWIPDPFRPGVEKKTKLVSFIDDATRVCVHAEFYWDEKLPTLVDCFRKALLKRGKPERILADNAFIYHSKAYRYMCSEIGIETSFCKAYSPEGKGKIERHFGSIKGAFFKEAKHADIKTLEELNKFFFSWLTKEYHHSKHSALRGLTPIERWRQDEDKLVRVTPKQVRLALRVRAERKVNYRTANIQLENRSFQASPGLAGKVVEVRWAAGYLDEIDIYLGGQFVETAKPVLINDVIDFSRKREKKGENPRRVLESSKRYKESLMRSYDGEVRRYEQKSEYLTEVQFIGLFADILERQLESIEEGFLESFFKTYAPMKMEFVRQLLRQAVSVRGAKMPIRCYLEHIQSSLFQGRR